MINTWTPLIDLHSNLCLSTTYLLLIFCNIWMTVHNSICSPMSPILIDFDVLSCLPFPSSTRTFALSPLTRLVPRSVWWRTVSCHCARACIRRPAPKTSNCPRTTGDSVICVRNTSATDLETPHRRWSPSTRSKSCRRSLPRLLCPPV